VVSTFHAGSAPGALSRLLDMGIEPYLITSGIRAVIHQRLVRRLCECASGIDGHDFLGLPVSKGLSAAGCERCRHSGYHGRLPLAELLPPLTGSLNSGILERRDVAELTRLARAAGMVTVFERACAAVEAGLTDPAEVRRVLGFLDASGPPA
jgi:type II secretory ATPase GspE/PulE/Tfp pilus assembly ATPase PilB-like protein